MDDKQKQKDLCHAKGQVYYWHTLKERMEFPLKCKFPQDGVHLYARISSCVCNSKAHPPSLLISQIKTVVARATLNATR